MTNINLDGLDKADVLAVLYNSSKPLGLGFMQYDSKPMNKEEAQTILDSGRNYFDYLKGRVMKVDLSRNTLDTRLYDRDNGQGAAESAISALRSTSQINPDNVQAAHHKNTQNSAEELRDQLRNECGYQTSQEIPGFVVYHITPGDVVDVDALEIKIEDAVKSLKPKK